MGLDSAGSRSTDYPISSYGKLEQPPKVEKKPAKKPFSEKESERRSSFLHRLENKPDFRNITDPSKDVSEEVSKFNKSNSELSNKYLLSTRETDNNTRTLQISQKNVIDGDNPTPVTRHLVDIDFMGDGITEICTNDLQATLEAMQEIGFDKAKDFGLIRLIVGDKTRYVVLQANLAEKRKKLESKLGKPGTQLTVIDKNPTTTGEDPAKKIDTLTTAIVPVGKPKSVNEIVRVTKHERTDEPPKQKKSLHFGVAAAVGGHKVETTYLNAAGKEVKVTRQSTEVLMQAAERFASSQMSEVAAKRESGFLPTVKTYIERFWRGTLTKGIHEKKEKFHGIEIMAAAGVETGITAEFNAEIDKRARAKIEAERSKKKGGKFFGALRDFGNEFLGRERDLHREKVLITAELRAQYMSNPNDDTNPIFALLQRDSLVREALAENIMTSPVDFLHAGDKKTAEFKVDSDSIFGKFLREEVLLKIKDDVITESKKPGYNNKISGKLRAELDQKIQDFFFSDKFQEYRKTLSVEDQKRFENSLTYATNILSQAETSFIPLIKENADFMTTGAAMDMDIFLTLGTAQLGPKGEIKAPSVFDKDRISNNQALFDRLREVRRKSPKHNAAGMYSDSELKMGEKRDIILAAAHSVATSEMLWAAAGALSGRLWMTAARGATSWIPLGGGIMAGAISGYKEFNNTTDLRGQYLVESAEGYDHPSSVNAVRSEAMRRTDYYRIDLGHRIQQLDFSIGELSKANPPTEAQILQTIAYMADSEARIRLGDKGGYSLFTTSKDSSGEMGIFQAQETIHNKSRTLALTKLQELLDGDDHKDLRAKIATAMGADPAKMVDSANLIHTLAKSQEIHLHDGTKVSKEFMAVMGMDPKLVIEKEQSIQDRDQAFNKYRWIQGFKNGVITGSLAALFAEGARHYQDIEFETIKKGVVEGPIKILDHTLPTHVTGLPDGSNGILHPETNELVGATFTHIPEGSYWVEDATKPGAFDLMTNHDDVRTTLLDNVTFNENHEINMTADILEDMKTNHLNIKFTAQDPIEWVTNTTAEVADNTPIGWNSTIKYSDLPGGSLDAYFNNNLHETFAANPPVDANGDPIVIPYNGITNSLRFLTRSSQLYGHPDGSNVQFSDGIEHDLSTVATVNGTEIISAPQVSTLELTNMPDYLVGVEGNRKVANLVIEAIGQKHAGVPFSDKAHELAWEISERAFEEDVPKADELAIITNYLEQGATTTTPTPQIEQFVPYDTWITPTEDVVVQGSVPLPQVVNHTVWNPVSLFLPGATGSIYRPLEAVEVKTATQSSRPAQSVTPTPAGTPAPIIKYNSTVIDDEGKREDIPANPEPKPLVNLNESFSLIAQTVATEVNEQVVSLGTEHLNTRKNVNNVMNTILDKRNLPVAYVIDNLTVQVLTRPPEVINDKESKVYFFNPKTGKEESRTVQTDGDVRGRSTIFLSNAAVKLPNESTHSNPFFIDYTLATEHLQKLGYNYSNFETSPYTVETKTEWAADIAAGTAFVIAATEAKKNPPAPKKPQSDEIGGEDKSSKQDSRYVPKEVAPGFTPEDRKEMLEAIFPASITTDEDRQAWLVHENKTLGMENFINRERAALVKSGQEGWSSENEKNKWLSSSETAAIAGKYHIPMAFMMRNSHAFVLTKPPAKTKSGYELHYYDPFKDGEQVLVLSEAESKDRNNTIYYTQGNDVVPQKWGGSDQNYDTAITQLNEYGYDLTIPVIPGKEWLSEAKGKLTQEDGQNCTLWSIYHAAIAWAIKPGHNKFKDKGAAIWERQLGFHLLQYEDVIGTTPVRSVDPVIGAQAVDHLDAMAGQASQDMASTPKEQQETVSFIQDISGRLKRTVGRLRRKKS